MRFEWKPCLLATVVGAALLAAATPATAQVVGSPYYRPYTVATPYGITQGPGYPAYTPATITNNPAAVSNPYLTTTPDPFYNPSPYAANPYSSYYNPAGGFLSGAADLVNARANSTVTYQKALLTQEEVFRSQLDTRRKIWEEARYERASLMNSEQMRLGNIRSALERARNDPPKEEIWSALSLNDLFKYLDAQQGKLTQSQIDQLPKVAVNEDVLKHINLTTGTGGNVGLLKSEIRWPTTLQRPEFEETRKKLDEQLQEAVRQAKFGAVNANLASDIKTNVQRMQDILLKTIDSIQPDDYQKAKTYLTKLDDATRALSDPNVSNYFSGKWSPKGKTVDLLISDVSKNGLRFAPAAPGDEWAYMALYRAMRDYDAGMVQFVGATAPKLPLP